MFTAACTAILATAPGQPPPPAAPITFGIGYGRDRQTRKVVVTTLDRLGVAAQMGLNTRDELVSINGRRVSTEDDVRSELRRVVSDIRVEFVRPGPPGQPGQVLRADGHIRTVVSDRGEVRYLFVPSSPSQMNRPRQ
jgi:predicted metalloprotease with PDZ domain